MKAPAYRQIGHIIKPHGLKGQLKVRLRGDAPATCYAEEMLFLQPPSGALSHYDVQAFHETQPGFALLWLKSVSDRHKAEQLRSSTVHIPQNSSADLTDSAEGMSMLLGYRLLSGGNVLGALTEVHALPKNPLFSMTDDNQKTHLIPAHADLIAKIDHSTGCIYMNLPDGLLELP